jgi:ABC-type transport system substrate-binding protein
MFIEDKEIDRLIDEASHETDEKKRIALYETIQERVLEKATIIPLAFGSWKKYYWSSRVKDVPAHPIGIQFLPFEMIRMKKP